MEFLHKINLLPINRALARRRSGSMLGTVSHRQRFGFESGDQCHDHAGKGPEGTALNDAVALKAVRELAGGCRQLTYCTP